MTVTTIPADQIEIFDPEGAFATYQFGTMTTRHQFCSRCGIHTFVETRLNTGHYRINLGCVDKIKSCMTANHFDVVGRRLVLPNKRFSEIAQVGYASRSEISSALLTSMS